MVWSSQHGKREGRFASPLRWGRLCRLGKLACARLFSLPRDAKGTWIGKNVCVNSLALDRVFDREREGHWDGKNACVSLVVLDSFSLPRDANAKYL